MKYEYFKNTGNHHTIKKEELQDTSSPLPKLSTMLDSDSSCTSMNSDEDDYFGNTYNEMIWRIFEGREVNGE